MQQNTWFAAIACVMFLGLCVSCQAQIVVTPAEREPVLKIGGLLQVQADFGDQGDGRFTTGDDRFYLRRARLNATGSFLEDFEFKLEMDLSASLSNNSTSVSTSNLRAQLTDGYVNWNKYASANIRGGQFKSPFGYEQLYPDPRVLTIERSLVNDRLTIGRQIGVMLNGEAFEKRLSYATSIFNGNNVNVSFNDNDKFLYAERAAGVLYDGKLFGQSAKWTLGGNAFFSEDKNLTGQSSDFQFNGNTFTGKRRGVGIDSQLHLGKLDVWTEYLADRFQPEDHVPREEFTPNGWYLMAGYFFYPRAQGVVRYETFDPVLIASTDTWTFGFNYLIKGDDLKIQINYLRTDAGGLPDTQNKILCRFQLMF
ncbi:MAG TPA: porin [Acidobacteriota bacterium]|nr:porin [Acidobacteriota bacterium]